MPKGPAAAAAPKNHLPQSFYVVPGQGFTTMTRAELRETLLATDGQVLARGNLWEIVAKHLGAGVYRVTLRLHKDGEA
jgi:hypothetical protein